MYLRDTIKRVSTTVWGLPGLLLLGLITRFLGIAYRPIWYDEAFSILFSQTGISKMIYGTLASVNGAAADIHPLAYYSLLWIWQKIVGGNVISARVLSITVGVFTLIISYSFLSKYVSQKVAKTSVLLIGLSPFQVHYSQEIRMYSLLGFLCMLSTWSLVTAAKTGKRRYWILFSLSVLLAQYTHNLAILYLFPLVLCCWFSFKYPLRPFGYAIGGAVLLYLPWGVNLLRQVKMVQTNYWVQTPGVERLITLILSYVTNLPLPGVIPLAVGLVCSVGIVAVCGWQTIKSAKSRKIPPAVSLLIWLTITPALIMYGLSAYIPIYIERALITSALCFLMWVGWCMEESGLPKVIEWTLRLLCIIGFTVGLFYHVNYRGFPYITRESVDWLIARSEPGSVIAHSNKLSFLPMRVYVDNADSYFFDDPEGSGSQTLKPPTQEVLGIHALPFDDVDELMKYRSVYFVIFQRAVEEYEKGGYPQHPHLQKLFTLYPHHELYVWDDLLVYYFYR